jgi:hypothetical protein
VVATNTISTCNLDPVETSLILPQGSSPQQSRNEDELINAFNRVFFKKDALFHPQRLYRPEFYIKGYNHSKACIYYRKRKQVFNARSTAESCL